MSQQSIPERLKAAETPEDFEDILAEVDTGDLALLPGLYECFIEDAAALPLMWQLLHLIEDFEEEAGLLALIEKTPYLKEHAPKWLDILWVRVLNSDTTRTRLQHEILPLLDTSELFDYLQSQPSLWPKAKPLFPVL